MAEQPFLVGNKARELLRYTQRATRIVSTTSAGAMPGRYFRKPLRLRTSAK